MKRKLIAVFLVLSMLLSVGACSDDAPSGEATEPTSLYQTVADFEQWGPDFQLLALHNYFGAIEKNTDKAFVKSGEASAKLLPMGSYVNQGQFPYMTIPLTSVLFNFDYMDFSQYEELTMNFYNNTDNDMPAYVALTYRPSSLVASQPSSMSKREQYILKSKQWTEVSYPINSELLKLLYTTGIMDGIVVGFDNQRIESRDDAPEIYLDDVVLKNSLVKPEPIQLDLKSDGKVDEILDFEKLYQGHVVMPGPTDVIMTEISAINASQSGVPAPSGNNYLRVLAKSGHRFTNSTYTSRVVIPNGIVEKVMAVEDADGIMRMKHKDEDEFVFNAYNNTDEVIDIGIALYPSDRFGQFAANVWVKDGVAVPANTEGAVHFSGLTLKLLPHKWTEYRISVGKIKTFMTAYPLHNLTHIAKIGITWQEFLGQDKEMFFDNFRVEIAEGAVE